MDLRKESCFTECFKDKADAPFVFVDRVRPDGDVVEVTCAETTNVLRKEDRYREGRRNIRPLIDRYIGVSYLDSMP